MFILSVVLSHAVTETRIYMFCDKMFRVYINTFSCFHLILEPHELSHGYIVKTELYRNNDICRNAGLQLLYTNFKLDLLYKSYTSLQKSQDDLFRESAQWSPFTIPVFGIVWSEVIQFLHYISQVFR